MGVKGHSRSLKVVPLHRFWDIRLQKCRDLENRVRGASRSLEMSPCDRALMTSYWRSMALSRVVSEILNVEKYCDLEIGVRGHSRSLKVVPLRRSCMVSYECSLVTLSLNAPFLRYSTCKYTVTLKPRLGVTQGHWKCHHVIEQIWLPVDVLWLYLVSFLRYSMSKNVVTLKSGSKVTQGHWKLYHAIERVWFPISVL